MTALPVHLCYLNIVKYYACRLDIKQCTYALFIVEVIDLLRILFLLRSISSFKVLNLCILLRLIKRFLKFGQNCGHKARCDGSPLTFFLNSWFPFLLHIYSFHFFTNLWTFPNKDFRKHILKVVSEHSKTLNIKKVNCKTQHCWSTLTPTCTSVMSLSAAFKHDF